MKQHTVIAEIAAPPREVFQILAQPGRLHLTPTQSGTQLTVTVIYATPKNALLTSATDWLVRYLTGRIVEGVRVSLQRREVLATAL